MDHKHLPKGVAAYAATHGLVAGILRELDLSAIDWYRECTHADVQYKAAHLKWSVLSVWATLRREYQLGQKGDDK